jgi:prepilin-type N-terminal cleavage/methylation domain-containing protein/prepilin-type processing-associated H-X9-DG protein
LDRRLGFTLVELLVVIAIIGVLVALLLPAVQAARESSRRMQCSNHLKQLGLGAHNHADIYGHFPTAGRSGYVGVRTVGPAIGKDQEWGWMYQILPFIEQKNLWENTNDNTVKQTPIKIYFCPSRRSQAIILPLANGALCDYVGNSGAGLNSFKTANWMPVGSTYAGLGGHGVIAAVLPATSPAINPLRFADIPDGTSNTMLASEKALSTAFYRGGDGNDNQGWWRGMDSDIVGGIYVPVSPTPAPAYKLQADQKWGAPGVSNTYNYSGNFSMFGSAHPGGINAALCDGSVRVIRYTVDINNVLTPLCVRDDALTFTLD